MGYLGPVYGCAADEHGSHAVEAHHQGGIIKLEEAVALGVEHDAYTGQGRGNSRADDTHPVHVHARGLGELGVCACRAHGHSRFAAHEKPHEEAEDEEEDHSYGRDVKAYGSGVQIRRGLAESDALAADVKGKGRCAEHLAKARVQVDGGAHALAAQRPNQLAVLKGQGEPHDVH